LLASAGNSREVHIPQISKRLLLGLGAACLIMESVLFMPASAADSVSLFKVITAKDEIVIGPSGDELAQVEGKDAGGIAKDAGEERIDERVAIHGA
jgi:hypothetical protein